MKISHDKSPKGRAAPSKWVVVALFVTSAFGGVALLGLTLTGISMIRAGRGQETFHTFWLMEYDWNGWVVGIVTTVVAVIGAGIYRVLFRWWEERELFRKYGTGRDN